MTTFNTDYNNTELLDQELTIEQLECVAGGVEFLSYRELVLKDIKKQQQRRVDILVSRM
ncbi:MULTISPECIES: hypothetical protein [unclassified Prochlorococcus]|uniref:hypothetical protein n=1 Tax=unclassified Prochlorococcus TaxID=2627481 RepID=UPI000533AB71|nr:MULTISPECIES: hypothetical protein [unclassified Prochlorococcus]KGG27146.1 hypothetical protein EV12_1401 [Prochlorococcus sp. MIT 0701]KGG28887.1 hypothetical protein EV13_1400 [Prochlorococcus sp. MIT 0702]KGG37180.1 hypothetical protein EV14_0123 [Prochlorococcus sp. MIT 0703]